MAESSIQEAKIPFVPDQQSGLEELAGGSPVALNISVDSLGAVTRRPGFSNYGSRSQSASTDRITALHESNTGKLFGIREIGVLRRVIEISTASERDMSTGGTLLPGALRPILSETEDRVVAVGGDKTVQWDPDGGLGQLATILPGDPPLGSHIIANAERLLLNDLTQTPGVVWLSDVSGDAGGGYEGWSIATGPTTGSASSFQALPNREPVLALAEGAGQVFVWGRSRMQLFVPDAQVIYAPESAKELGCAAPYSIVKVDSNFAWLDHMRRFVMSDGRSSTPMSDPFIQATLNNMTTVSDCFGWRFLHGNTDATIWTFPTDGRTFVFQKGAGWSQWQGGGSPWSQFPVLSHELRTSNNENVIGTSDGRIGLMRPDTTTDFGETFTASVTTGFQDRGTSRLKACRAVRITLRRGESGQVVEPVGFLHWRNDLGDWQGGIPVGFGAPSDRAVVGRFPSVGGAYSRRQWKWAFCGVWEMALADVTEEFEVLGS